jgi:competence protein ComEC
VLKVAHHGSRTSTSEMFLQATRPRSASISVGVRNGYSHPAPEVVDRLRAHRIHVLRTDRDGMITWRFDERGARVRVSGRGLATRAAGGLVPVVLPRLQ